MNEPPLPHLTGRNKVDTAEKKLLPAPPGAELIVLFFGSNMARSVCQTVLKTGQWTLLLVFLLLASILMISASAFGILRWFKERKKDTT